VGLPSWRRPHGLLHDLPAYTTGYVRTNYSGEEIDAVAVYSADTHRCYLLPIADVERLSAISLRLTPTGNNQSRKVRWARDYELHRTIERRYKPDCLSAQPSTTDEAIR
jgi:hypothetical protein